MMSKLEEVNLDNNKVGWYQISYANDHLSGDSVAITYDYQVKTSYYVIKLIFTLRQVFHMLYIWYMIFWKLKEDSEIHLRHSESTPSI